MAHFPNLSRATEEAASHSFPILSQSVHALKLAEVFRTYFALTQAASESLATEVEAVTRIQSVFRASKIRRSWRAVVGATLMIQRAVRGWSGRRKARSLRFQRLRHLQNLFFKQSAVVIQRFFRGWWSRRHLHDFQGRKRYIGRCAQRGEWTHTYLAHEHRERLALAKMEEEQQMRREFRAVAGEIHHLVSTKSVPGVYNPPYNDHLPRAFDKPIEQHLRESLRVHLPMSMRRPRRVHTEASRPQLQPQGARMGVSQAEQMADLAVSGPPQELPDRVPCASRTASTGRCQRVQGPFRSREQIEVANVKAANLYKSVQASSPYDAVERDQKMQNKLTKMLRTSPEDFLAPGRAAERPPPASVHTSVPYLERPFQLRNDYLELPKIRDKPPFYTAFPNNKNFQELQEQPLLPCGHV
ncbi:SPATA17 [Symbiodinium pilosum]|uniref:SPATA17 protein n=1 Tax=Symbiodinium pilosum TaxID=2952 RepID=A0A812PIK2_SYMPI|nr:SPATA17 [Symbiodinium pilosum]